MRVALVTGGNKGIGLEVCRALVESGQFTVILTARNERFGSFAAASVCCDFMELDTTSDKSISQCVEAVRTKHGGLDALVNNAGVAFKHSNRTPFGEQAQPTLAVNFWGTLAVTEAFLPLMRPGGQVVNMASSAGHLNSITSEDLRTELGSAGKPGGLSLSRLQQLMKDFVSAAEKGTHAMHGWPNSCYAVSKLGVIALTRILAGEQSKRDVTVSCCCPGYCYTDMTSHRGTRSPAEGAETPAWLAAGGGGTDAAGKFLKDKKMVEW
jgi:NAD(P)-dependent dehydrogenase (short-subunit alcohol dehydrogenase family)